MYFFAVSCALAATLSGCGGGGGTTAAPTAAPTPAPPTHPLPPDGLTIGYLRVDGTGGDQAALEALMAKVDGCNVQGLPGSGNYGKKVDDKCCKVATWTGAGAAAAEVSFTEWKKVPEGGSGVYTCIPGNIGKLTLPSEMDQNGKPIKFVTFPEYWVRGYQDCVDKKVVWSERCGTDEMKLGNTTYSAVTEYFGKDDQAGCDCNTSTPLIKGDGCFVGNTFPGMTFFAKSSGDALCAKTASSEWMI